MLHNHYALECFEASLKFEFYSEGPKGKIKKQVAFKPFDHNADVYNLGFGDVDAAGRINDTVTSDNGDHQKVLVTVTFAVQKFYEEHPDCWVFASGTTRSRIRLYRIGIASNLERIQNDFWIFGLIEGVWEPFTKGREYAAFLIKKKN